MNLLERLKKLSNPGDYLSTFELLMLIQCLTEAIECLKRVGLNPLKGKSGVIPTLEEIYYDRSDRVSDAQNCLKKLKKRLK